MIINVKIKLDDEQRKILARRMGRSRLSKAPLATRPEVNLILNKCMRALVSTREPDLGNSDPTAGEEWFDEYLADTCNGALFGE